MESELLQAAYGLYPHQRGVAAGLPGLSGRFTVFDDEAGGSPCGGASAHRRWQDPGGFPRGVSSAQLRFAG